MVSEPKNELGCARSRTLYRGWRDTPIVSDVTEDQVIEKIREWIVNPRKFTSAARYRAATVFSPASLEHVREGEDRLGFPLPTLLKRMYLEIGNGGFGPGYGLYGVAGGNTSDLANDQTIPDLYLEWEEWDEPAPIGWPKRWVPISDWGCCIESVIDCSTPEGRMVFVLDGIDRKDEGITFAQWMEDWAAGIDLFKRGSARKPV